MMEKSVRSIVLAKINGTDFVKVLETLHKRLVMVVVLKLTFIIDFNIFFNILSNSQGC